MQYETSPESITLSALCKETVGVPDRKLFIATIHNMMADRTKVRRVKVNISEFGTLMCFAVRAVNIC